MSAKLAETCLRAEKPVKKDRWGEPQGRNLRLLREAAHLSQRALAEKVTPEDAEGPGVTIDTVRNWEAGKNQPYPRHLEALAKLFGVDVERLFAPVAVLIPDFDVGLHFFCAPPVVARETLVVEPIMRKLRATGLDFYRVDDFGTEKLRAELDALLEVSNVDSRPQYKASLVAWAKVKHRALVLSAFHPTADSEWNDYIDYIKWLKDYACIVVVQMVDPFHVQAVLASASRYEAKSHCADIEFADSKPSASELRAETPSCCRRTIADILDDRCGMDDWRECIPKLLEAKIISKTAGRLSLNGGDALWREAVTV
jgi:DNA-binding XRE family transcriptional regulator